MLLNLVLLEGDQTRLVTTVEVETMNLFPPIILSGGAVYELVDMDARVSFALEDGKYMVEPGKPLKEPRGVYRRVKAMVLLGGTSPRPFGGHPDFTVRIGAENDAKGEVATLIAPIYTEEANAKAGTERASCPSCVGGELHDAEDRVEGRVRSEHTSQASAEEAEEGPAHDARDASLPRAIAIQDWPDQELGDPGA
jgi:hypothetical protein